MNFFSKPCVLKILMPNLTVIDLIEKMTKQKIKHKYMDLLEPKKVVKIGPYYDGSNYKSKSCTRCASRNPNFPVIIRSPMSCKAPKITDLDTISEVKV